MLVAIVGIDGAGKSTVVSRLGDEEFIGEIPVKVFDKWDLLDPKIHPECRFLNKDLDMLRVCISEMNGLSRTQFLFWLINHGISQSWHSLADSICILDGYWFKHAAAEISLGNKSEDVELLGSLFAKPDLTFHIRTLPEESLKRKSSLTPYECGRDENLSKDKFIFHQRRILQILDRWSADKNWIVLDGCQSPDKIFESVLSRIKDFI